MIRNLALAVVLLLPGMGTHEGAESGRVLRYPIAPVSLLELIEAADFIGAVHVESVNGNTDEGPHFWSAGDGKVEVTVRECWRGDTKLPELAIYEDFGVVCPSPPLYYPGEDYLVFLKKTRRGYTTVGLSYGMKSAEHAAHYRAAFQRWQRIEHQLEGRSDEEHRRAEYIWMLDILFVPELRQDVLYALVPEVYETGLSDRNAVYRAWLLKTHPDILRPLWNDLELKDGSESGALWALWAILEPLPALDWLANEIRCIPVDAGRTRLNKIKSFCSAAEEADLLVLGQLDFSELIDRLARTMYPYDGSEPSPFKVEWARSANADFLTESRDALAAYVLASSR